MGHITWGYLIMKLRSNTILITGGGSGIGYELTKQITALCNTNLITGRGQSKMDPAKTGLTKNYTLRNDVFESETIATLYQQGTKQLSQANTLVHEHRL